MTFKVPALGLLCVLPLVAQDAAETTESAAATADVWDVSDFTPPVETPRIAPREFRVLKDRDNLSGGRLVAASIVENPQIPRPPKSPEPTEPVEPTEEQLKMFAEYREHHRFYGVGATVYAGTLTQFHWNHEGENYEGWSNIDFRLLQSIGDVEKNDITYSFFLLASGLDEPPPESDWKLTIPEHPELPKDQVAFVVTKGDPDNEKALEFIVALHEVYITNKEGLEAAYEKRLQYAREARAWREANPPQPRNIKVNFWRR